PPQNHTRPGFCPPAHKKGQKNTTVKQCKKQPIPKKNLIKLQGKKHHKTNPQLFTNKTTN
ncbi:hypothetical protein ACQWFX_26235, partial [Salmonella enterica subsp. enterica serovar Infantis]